MSMRTALFKPNQKIDLDTVDLPDIIEDEVLIEVLAAGICGSDLHRYRGNNPWGGDISYPYRAGHEIAGRVKKIGSQVKGLEPGQPVAVEPMQLAGCGVCDSCISGFYNRCQRRAEIIDRRVTYGFSEYDVARFDHVHVLPESMQIDVAALTDVYACALHAFNRMNIVSGQTIMIIGTGSVALALGQMAKKKNIETIVVGRRDKALQNAKQLDAADYCIVYEEDISKPLLQRLVSQAIDVVFEIVGGRDSSTLDFGLEVVKPGGTIAILGAFTDKVEISYQKANKKEISVCWCNGYAKFKGKKEFASALEWLSVNEDCARKLISHHVEFNNVQYAFELAANKSISNAIKVMLTLNDYQ